MTSDSTLLTVDTPSFLREIILHSPDCLKVVSADGLLLEMNPAGLRMLDANSYAQVLNRPIYDVVAEEDRAAMLDLHRRAMQGDDVVLEFSIVSFNGTRRRLETHATPLRDAAGKIVAVLGITRDITERERAKQEARLTALSLHMAVEGSNIGLWEWRVGSNDTRTFNIWGQLGYAEDDVPGGFGVWIDHVHPDDRKQTLARLQAFVANPYGTYESQYRMRHKNGSYRYIESKGIILRDNQDEMVRMVGSHLDVTERRAAEQQIRESNLRLRELSRKLAEAQESERRALSRELHDLIGQNLTALSVNFGFIETQFDAQTRQRVAAQLEESRTLLTDTIAVVRNLITDLRPVALEEYGLLPALRAYADSVQGRSGLVIHVIGDDATIRLPAEAELALFRVAQEAVTNVVNHARAKTIWITFARTGGLARLTIADDGVGFDPNAIASVNAHSHIGLLAMKERATGLGGRFEIESSPGNGTRVSVELPEHA